MDSGAPMHMLSKKDFSDEVHTVRVRRSPAKVITANGVAETDEEGVVDVKDLDLRVTVQFLQDTPPVWCVGKLSEYHGYSYE